MVCQSLRSYHDCADLILQQLLSKFVFFFCDFFFFLPETSWIGKITTHDSRWRHKSNNFLWKHKLKGLWLKGCCDVTQHVSTIIPKLKKLPSLPDFWEIAWLWLNTYLRHVGILFINLSPVWMFLNPFVMIGVHTVDYKERLWDISSIDGSMFISFTPVTRCCCF